MCDNTVVFLKENGAMPISWMLVGSVLTSILYGSS